MLDFHPSNPFKTPNWRWEYARTLRERKGKSTRGVEDQYVATAVKFQVKLFQCQDDIARWDLMDEYPELYSAYLIFQRGSNEDRHPMRYAIEARLLAGQKFNEISNLIGVPVQTIELYERMFFNVCDRLQNSDYIMTCVIGPSVHAGLSDRDYDLLWKLFGYLYGPAVLDVFITTTSQKYRPETINEVDTALAEDTRASLQRKVAVVARTYVLNPFSQSELLNTYARFLELEKESNTGKAQDVIMQNIQIMLDKLPWSTEESNVISVPQIAYYDSGASELRTDELLTLSVGGTLANKVEVDDLKFPEIKENDKPVK